jgi:hypothetical protein
MPHAPPEFGLVFAHPEKFCERKVRKCWIASQFNQSGGAQLPSEFDALGFGAYIAPDECRANDLRLRVQHDRAVHLAGEAHACNVRARQSTLCERSANCQAGGAPPIIGVLLSPADLGRGEMGVFLRCRGNDSTLFIKDQGPRSTSADIDS